MTKQEAIEKTKRRFTNLMDGKVVSNVSVATIINYYESLLNDQLATVESSSHFINNFVEEAVSLIENQQNEL
jgi:hypothetical protein